MLIKSIHFFVGSALAFGIFFLFAPLVHAQTLVPDTVVLMQARVLSTEDARQQQVPGTDVTSQFQTLHVVALDGPEAGNDITVENDFLQLQPGDIFYLRHTTNSLDATDYYNVVEPYRLPWVLGIIGFFVLIVLVVGGRQGARALATLAGSLALIFYVLLPGIIAGYPPILISIGIAAIIIIFGSYITHGFTKTTTSAVLGMIATILITGGFAWISVHGAQLSGFSTEESVYLNMNTRGSIDFSGLLLGGILIGLLGVLYDAAIGQAVAVEELIAAGPHLSRRFIFMRALRIGREHIGALVNTLALAYVGVSLPLLLLMYSSDTSGIIFTINRELFATEIVRSAIGSIGLILAVPVTTLIAVLMLHIRIRDSDLDKENEERIAIEAITRHGHEH